VIVCQGNPAFGEPANGSRKGLMFDGQHALGQQLRGVPRQDRHAALGDDGTVVQYRGDEMHRAAMHAHTGCQRLRMRVQAGKCGQQRRMDVDQAAGVMVDEAGRQHAHESGQDDVVGRIAVDFDSQRGIEGFAAGVVLVIQGGGGDALGGSPL